MERPVEMMIGACEQALEDAPPNAKGKLERELARLRAVLARLQT
jgi:hypothetical protein